MVKIENLRLIQILLALSFTTYGLFICLYGLIFYQFFIDGSGEKLFIYIVNIMVSYQLILYVLKHLAKIFFHENVFGLDFF